MYFSRLKGWNLKQEEFAFQAAAFCEKKGRFSAALFFYETLLSEMGDNKKSFQIKKTVAGLFFYKLKNYQKAIVYYQDLLKRAKSEREKFDMGYHLSESFRHLKKPSQALFEVNRILSFRGSVKNRKKAVLLKSSLLLSLKKYDEAEVFFRQQILKYPGQERFFRQYLALVFEHQFKTLAAIRELEKIKPSDAFVEQKIKALYERLENQPGLSL